MISEVQIGEALEAIQASQRAGIPPGANLTLEGWYRRNGMELRALLSFWRRRVAEQAVEQRELLLKQPSAVLSGMALEAFSAGVVCERLALDRLAIPVTENSVYSLIDLVPFRALQPELLVLR